jgi:hypothetical protein
MYICGTFQCSLAVPERIQIFVHVAISLPPSPHKQGRIKEERGGGGGCTTTNLGDGPSAKARNVASVNFLVRNCTSILLPFF